MYKLINATHNHATQILHYLTITCYWKEFVEGNLLNKSYEDFMLEWVVNPRIPLTKVLVDASNKNKIYGCLIAATLEELGTMPDYTPYLHPKVMETFGAWFSYPITDSIVLELYAVDNAIKGKGYGSMLLNATENLAHEKNKESISCFIWNCFYDSITSATNKNFTVLDCIKFPKPINLQLLYLEKNTKHSKFEDYFQSKPYQALNNLLLK